LGLSDQLTQTFWRACHRGPDSRSAALLYGLEHVLDAPNDQVLHARCRAFSLEGPARPALLIDLIEHFVVRTWLTRVEANHMQDIILQSVACDGTWKW